MICSRCVSNDTLPGIKFDAAGVCNYCHVHDTLEKRYPISTVNLTKAIDEIKKHRRGRYDCIVGVSGGKDSSYLLHLAVKQGLRPLAVHYDNGWDTEIAKQNIRVMTNALEVPLVNYRVKKKEVNSLILAFLLSHTKDAEAATDLGFVKCLFEVAEAFNIKYILDGHSFRTEGIAPIGLSYMDGKYVESVHKTYGATELDTYPLLTFWDQLKFGMSGIKRPRLLYHIYYDSKKTADFLSKYGWQWYGGHHLENYYTAFFDYIYRMNKLGFDGRQIEFSALIRSNQMTRDSALAALQNPQLSFEAEENIITRIKNGLNLDEYTFDFIMNPNKILTSDDWPNYKKMFKLFKPLFWAMAKTNRIPESFYLKYCKGVNNA